MKSPGRKTAGTWRKKCFTAITLLTKRRKTRKTRLKSRSNGYDFIDIFELGDEETDESTGEYLLHIDKVETHTPESLAERNVEFQKLADEYEIESYDGWEFGEVGGEDEESEFDDDIIEAEE